MNPVDVMNPVDSARAVVDAAVSEFGDSLVVLTSFQREGVVIVDLAMGAGHPVSVMTIDTGRLPEATLEMIGTVERRYGIRVERIVPEPAEVESMVGLHGRDLFYQGLAQRSLCCNVRKVRPLAARMAGIGAYFTGVRRGQSDLRAGVEVVDRSGSPVKISPLADWSAADVARYTAEQGLPEHPLYAAGYSSIGCDPCTRAITAGEDERAGRWWWESDADKECGLHFAPDGRVLRTVDVLLQDLLNNARI